MKTKDYEAYYPLTFSSAICIEKLNQDDTVSVFFMYFDKDGNSICSRSSRRKLYDSLDGISDFRYKGMTFCLQDFIRKGF